MLGLNPPPLSSAEEMLYLIDSLRATDEYISQIFLYGGCYQFHLFLKRFAPDCEPRISSDKCHIATYFKGHIFDISGPAKGIFTLPTEEEIEMASKWSFHKNRALVAGYCPSCDEPIKI